MAGLWSGAPATQMARGAGGGIPARSPERRIWQRPRRGERAERLDSARNLQAAACLLVPPWLLQPGDHSKASESCFGRYRRTTGTVGAGKWRRRPRRDGDDESPQRRARRAPMPRRLRARRASRGAPVPVQVARRCTPGANATAHGSSFFMEGRGSPQAARL